jgi:predicted MFS family arabinose efflux permease
MLKNQMLVEPGISIYRLDRLLKLLSFGSFIIFFQAYMLGPLIPELSRDLNSSPLLIGSTISAYLIPYGVMSLFYGIFSDYFGRKRIVLFALLSFSVLSVASGFVQNGLQLVILRALTGATASGFVPLSLILIGVLFPYERLGGAMSLIFASMAGGMAFGSTIGVILSPIIGWRILFLISGLVALFLYQRLSVYGVELDFNSNAVSIKSFPWASTLASYRDLLLSKRGIRTYSYVFLNGIFHSGVFTWLSVYFSEVYGIGAYGIGLALLGYGLPGFFFAPVIGKMADKYGKHIFIPLGFSIAAFSSLVLAIQPPIVISVIAVTALSLGYDMSQPLLAAIVTNLRGNESRGKAMGLNVFILFIGFGLGSYLFGEFIGLGLRNAYLYFGCVQMLASLFAVFLYRNEAPS